jgi:hypothetical protein
MPKRPPPITNVVRFAPTAKRLGALTTAQHEEIARLIKSSMDPTSKNPTPSLTPQRRILVEDEITILANFAFVRRTKNHSSTFTRALAGWERRLAETPNDPNDTCRQRIESEGRLAIELLWRWLHGEHDEGVALESLPQEESDAVGRVVFATFPNAPKSPDGANEDGGNRVLPFKQTGEKWNCALVRIKGAPQLGLMKIISTPIGNTLPVLAMLMSQGEIPLSAFEWVGPDPRDRPSMDGDDEAI